MRTLLILLLVSAAACSEAQGIGLDSGGGILLRDRPTNSRPLFLSPVFNAHNRFNFSVFSRAAKQGASRNPLFRKKQRVPDYVYENLRYFMQGINPYVPGRGTAVIYFNTPGRGTPVYFFNALGRSVHPVSPFDSRFYPYSPFRPVVVYGSYYWPGLLLYSSP